MQYKLFFLESDNLVFKKKGEEASLVHHDVNSRLITELGIYKLGIMICLSKQEHYIWFDFNIALLSSCPMDQSNS